MRRRITRSLAALGLVAAAALTAAAGLRSLGAWAIAKASNYDGASAVNAPTDVAWIVRAEVGDPLATIEAWILEPDVALGATLVLHGIGDPKRSMLGLGRELRARGQRAVLVDLRGHGASTGRLLWWPGSPAACGLGDPRADQRSRLRGLGDRLVGGVLALASTSPSRCSCRA